jgi:hypothetical protein
MEQPDTLDWLMRWYEAHCDGDWEHGNGPEIGTIDNPGWRLKVPLAGTECDGREFARLQHNYHDDTEWWTCWTENNEFHGAGGPRQLVALIETFRKWTETGDTAGEQKSVG